MTSYIPSITLPSQVFAHPATSIILPVVAGLGIGASIAPKSTQETYLALKQPPYRPPPQVFAPMWTTLYGLMGFAAYRAWTTGINSVDPITVENTRHGATLYTIQLGLNLCWMPLFYGLKRPIEATVDIVSLTGTVTYLTYVWSKVDDVAAYCLLPYLGWLGFATYLSAGAGYLNNWDFKNKEQSKDPKPADTKYVDEEPKA